MNNVTQNIEELMQSGKSPAEQTLRYLMEHGEKLGSIEGAVRRIEANGKEYSERLRKQEQKCASIHGIAGTSKMKIPGTMAIIAAIVTGVIVGIVKAVEVLAK